MKVTRKPLDALCNSKLFFGVSRELLSSLLEAQERAVAVYSKGDIIFSRDEYENSIGFILKGKVNVIKPVSGVLLSTLKKDDFFGAASLFSQRGYYPAKLVAAGDTKVIFIDKSTIGMLMHQDRVMTSNFIAYLSDKLYYLNEKIDAFTGGSAESRLAAYLIDSFGGYKTLRLKVTYTGLAASLDIGRASLYRAFDSFIDAGVIEKDGKFIRLINEEKLREYLGSRKV